MSKMKLKRLFKRPETTCEWINWATALGCLLLLGMLIQGILIFKS